MNTRSTISVTEKTRAFRQTIQGLVRGLCAVPREVRSTWSDELRDAWHRRDISPNDFVVLMVLINLYFAEKCADSDRERLKPKLHAIAGTGTVRTKVSSNDRGGRKWHTRPDAPSPAA